MSNVRWLIRRRGSATSFTSKRLLSTIVQLRVAMAEFCIDVLDGTVDPPQVRFETPTRTKLLGSAEALARALYERRHADGHAHDLIRVRYDEKTVFIYSYLNHVGHREQPGSPALLRR